MTKQYRLLDKQGNIKVVYSIHHAKTLVELGYKLLSSGAKAGTK